MRRSRSWKSAVKSTPNKPRWAAFSGRLKQARIAAGLTAKDAADRLKVPYATFSKWELGTRMPADIAEIERIAIAFGTSARWLAFGTEGEKESTVEARLGRIESDLIAIKTTLTRIFR
jgi:transcriptional regulator with XRE-family HTH domain